MFLAAAVFVTMQTVVQGRVDVQRRGGHRVHRHGDGRQYLVIVGADVSAVEIAVIAVSQGMVAVVTAENHRVAVRQRGAEESHRLKSTRISISIARDEIRILCIPLTQDLSLSLAPVLPFYLA